MLKNQLHEEANYELEAKNLNLIILLMIRILKSLFCIRIFVKNVLTMQYKPGIPIDEIMTYSQDEKNKIFYKLMELLFKEIFDFGYIQTDPNYSNFFI